VMVAVAVGVRVTVGVSVAVGVAVVAVVVGVSVAVAVGVGVSVAVEVAVAVGVNITPVAVGVALPVAVGVAVAPVAVGVAESVAVGVALPVGVDVAVVVAVAVGVVVAEEVALGVGLSDGVGVLVIVGVFVAVAVGTGVRKAAGPPPTKVGKSPQSSTTTRVTVTPWPALCWRTKNSACTVPGPSVTVKLPVCPCGPSGTSIRALVAPPKWNARRVFVGVDDEVTAVMFTWSRLDSTRTTATFGLGRGAQVWSRGAAGARRGISPSVSSTTISVGSPRRQGAWVNILFGPGASGG
jgi:hypothetical protein